MLNYIFCQEEKNHGPKKLRKRDMHYANEICVRRKNYSTSKS